MPGIEIYVASKHAVIGLTKSAAMEFGKQGIRVNAILPAVIDTDMFQRFAGEKPDFRAQMSAMHPIGRIGKSEEIADAAIWLSSSKSSFVTGHSLLALTLAASPYTVMRTIFKRKEIEPTAQHFFTETRSC